MARSVYEKALTSGISVKLLEKLLISTSFLFIFVMTETQAVPNEPKHWPNNLLMASLFHLSWFGLLSISRAVARSATAPKSNSHSARNMVLWAMVGLASSLENKRDLGNEPAVTSEEL